MKICLVGTGTNMADSCMRKKARLASHILIFVLLAFSAFLVWMRIFKFGKFTACEAMVNRTMFSMDSMYKFTSFLSALQALVYGYSVCSDLKPYVKMFRAYNTVAVVYMLFAITYSAIIYKGSFRYRLNGLKLSLKGSYTGVIMAVRKDAFTAGLLSDTDMVSAMLLSECNSCVSTFQFAVAAIVLLSCALHLVANVAIKTRLDEPMIVPLTSKGAAGDLNLLPISLREKRTSDPRNEWKIMAL